MKYSLIYKILVGGLLVVMSGCKITTPQGRSSYDEAPSSFTNNDTPASSASIAWRDFFQDQKLITLIEEALENNLDRQIALQRITMAQANLRIARGLKAPSLELVAEPGVRRFGDHTMDGVGNFDTNFSPNIKETQKMSTDLPDYYLGFRSSWEILAWGKLKNKRKAAYAQWMASEEGKHLVTTAMVTEVAKAYYNLLTLDNELSIVTQSIALQERVVEIISVQRSTGHATELGVKQVAAQLLNTKALAHDIRQRIVEEENFINFLLGRFPRPIERSGIILQQSLLANVSAGVPSEMLTKRPDIRQAEWRLQAARADMLAARKAFYPSLTITSSIGLQTFNFDRLFNPGSLAYSVFGGLTAPLFKNNQIKAGYEYASAEQFAMVAEYQKAVINAFQEVTSHLSRVDNLSSKATFKEEEVKVLREGIEISNELYLVGMANYLEVISAQRNALEAELQLAETKRDQFYVLIDLYKSIGGGW
jgi:multidrug efflux system outer membrane protein